MEKLHINQLAVTKIFDVITVIYNKPFKNNMYNRPFYGISMAIDGKIIYHHNGKEYVSDEGHAILLPKGASYVLDCRKPGKFTLVNFLCDKTYNPPEFLIYKVSNIADFLKEHQALERLNLSQNPQNQAEFFSIFYQTLSKLSGNISNKSGPAFLRLAVSFIEQNLADSLLSVKMAADYAGISEAYLRRMFQNEYKLSPKQYIVKLRINAAKALLTNSSCSITAVAEKCGFASVYHFCRAFKNICGQTPRQ